MLRDVRTLLARRQPALGYLDRDRRALGALDLADAALRHQFHSFSHFSRVEFDNFVQWRAIASLRDAPVAVSVLVLVTVPLGGVRRPRGCGPVI